MWEFPICFFERTNPRPFFLYFTGIFCARLSLVCTRRERTFWAPDGIVLMACEEDASLVFSFRVTNTATALSFVGYGLQGQQWARSLSPGGGVRSKAWTAWYRPWRGKVPHRQGEGEARVSGAHFLYSSVATPSGGTTDIVPLGSHRPPVNLNTGGTHESWGVLGHACRVQKQRFVPGSSHTTRCAL